jgi:hypothetical protein
MQMPVPHDVTEDASSRHTAAWKKNMLHKEKKQKRKKKKKTMLQFG